MIKLNFTIAELCKSDMAIKNNISNAPDLISVDRLLDLICNVLQPIRNKFGVIVVTSGFRSHYVNKLVGGVSNSNHLYGYAADIIPKQATFKQVYDFIVNNLDYDECFIEKNSTGTMWLHVAYRKGNNRRKRDPNYLAQKETK